MHLGFWVLRNVDTGHGVAGGVPDEDLVAHEVVRKVASRAITGIYAAKIVWVPNKGVVGGLYRGARADTHSEHVRAGHKAAVGGGCRLSDLPHDRAIFGMDAESEAGFARWLKDRRQRAILREQSGRHTVY